MESWPAPDLVDVETVSVLRKRWLAGTLTARRFSAAVDDLRGPRRRPLSDPLPFMRRAYQLRANVTAYDAVYIALAETLDYELVTGDGPLAGAAGPRCRVRVLTS